MSILTTEEREQIKTYIRRVDGIVTYTDLNAFEQKLFLAKDDLTKGVFSWVIRAVEIQREVIDARRNYMIEDGEIKGEEF